MLRYHIADAFHDKAEGCDKGAEGEGRGEEGNGGDCPSQNMCIDCCIKYINQAPHLRDYNSSLPPKARLHDFEGLYLKASKDLL